MDHEHPERPWRVELRHTDEDASGQQIASWQAVDRSRFASKESAEAHLSSLAVLESGQLRVERAVHFEASE